MTRDTVKCRRAKKYSYVKNKQRREKKKAKKQVKVLDLTLKSAWNFKRSVQTNLDAVGLASDPNQVVAKPSTVIFGKNKPEAKPKKALEKPEVLEIYEKEAAIPEQYRVRFTANLTRFVVYLLDKYGDDYEAAARDRQNYDQYSATQIRKKIENFKKQTELYETYLLMKGNGTLNQIMD